MKSNWRWVAICIFALCSCDRDKPRSTSSSTRPSDTAEAPDVLDRRPKAPVALERTIHLADCPLTLRVPEQWMMNYGAVTILEGPTPGGKLPDGRLHLIVSRKGPIPKIVLDSLKPASTKPATVPALDRDEMRMLGKMKVYERRWAEPSTAGLPAMMKWTLSAYEPLDNENVRLYQITFLDLTREHFEKDRQLLESIVKSLALAEESTETIK